MNGRGLSVGAAICLILLANSASAQMEYRPTPAPVVTAGEAEWYLAGEPVEHAGFTYYRAGPQIHFLPFEMVRGGVYQGVPLYLRTTLEANSVVFVPVGRGLMQPYERRRDGDLAGTVGSQAPSFPVARSADDTLTGVIQAPAPPARTPVVIPDAPAGSLGLAWPEPVGTSGTARAAAPASAPARLPGRTDGIFIEFQGTRWYSDGLALRLERTSLERQGERQGQPVYGRAGDAAIYVPVSSDEGAPLVRYVRR